MAKLGLLAKGLVGAAVGAAEANLKDFEEEGDEKRLRERARLKQQYALETEAVRGTVALHRDKLKGAAADRRADREFKQRADIADRASAERQGLAATQATAATARHADITRLREEQLRLTAEGQSEARAAATERYTSQVDFQTKSLLEQGKRSAAVEKRNTELTALAQKRVELQIEQANAQDKAAERRAKAQIAAIDRQTQTINRNFEKAEKAADRRLKTGLAAQGVGEGGLNKQQLAIYTELVKNNSTVDVDGTITGRDNKAIARGLYQQGGELRKFGKALFGKIGAPSGQGPGWTAPNGTVVPNGGRFKQGGRVFEIIKGKPVDQGPVS